MKNRFGGSVQVTLFGESHGAYVGATVDGLAPGIPVDPDRVRRKLSQRAPAGRFSTARMSRSTSTLSLYLPWLMRKIRSAACFSAA